MLLLHEENNSVSELSQLSTHRKLATSLTRISDLLQDCSNNSDKDLL